MEMSPWNSKGHTKFGDISAWLFRKGNIYYLWTNAWHMVFSSEFTASVGCVFFTFHFQAYWDLRHYLKLKLKIFQRNDVGVTDHCLNSVNKMWNVCSINSIQKS